MRNKGIRRISVSDIRNIPLISGMSEFDIISPQNQDDVYAYLFALGVDVNRSVHVQACRHRNIAGKAVMGYSFVGHERMDKDWLDKPYSSLEARIEAAKDPDLQGDMIQMSTENMSWAKFKEMCWKAKGLDGTTNKEGPMEPLESFQEDIEIMATLRNLQIKIRGNINPMEEDMLFFTNN